MTTESFQLKQCWESQRIGQVINKEATSVDTATFMATHTPLTKLEYQTYLQQMTDMTEEGLFRELQRCAERDDHVFMAVQGIPGSGKSHLIRWLKERYSVENGESECVLFIARAQCSLRSTLEQIIDSGVFEETLMHEQQKQLKNARGALSKEALAETLLNQISVESIEVREVHVPRWLKPREKLKAFLWDLKIREELLKRGGPIDRIVRFLTEGMGTGARTSEIPQFVEGDFQFDSKMLREIAGYPDAREIAMQLQGRRVEREDLARYFNRLLPYAIGHVTALTSDDFKHIFLDLRRELRKQGRQLALFIEDITALTGIDLGLLDVLVAQHVGETNQDLCRVTSVLGITNSYYRDHFPDHMKDRVTHSLTLNATTTNVSDTEFLSDENATAEMAARYLNAMRLKPEVIRQWFDAGSKPELMPNACESCPVKTACHQAFGYQQIVVGPQEELHIGLYPFNKTSLWKFYQRIPTASNKRTPRSFLHSVLYYVLQSHGDKIKIRQFPPAPSDLGGEFTTFSLEKPLQRNLIGTQGKLDAKRIETLVALWGNGTIDAYDRDQTHFVGTLSPAVFTAFGITPIQGEQLATTSSDRTDTLPSAVPVRVIRDSAPADISASKAVSPPMLFPAEDVETQQQDYKRHLYTDQLTEWLNGGKLQRYEYYSDLLASMIRTFINWDSYEISSVQLDEVLKGRRNIYIEDQVGKATSAYFHKFERSTELANVFQALSEIKEHGLDLRPELLGAHISNISIWLHQHEAEIVRFVQQPNHDSTNTLPFVTVLILDCLLIACLAGKLSASKSSPTDLLKDLMRFCKDTTEASWGEYQKSTSIKLRSSTWAGIVKRIKPTDVARLCSTLPRVLNCAQGDSTAVLFIDAATALSVLEHFQQTDWQLSPSGCIGKPLQEIWKVPLSTYELFYTHFRQSIEEELQSVQQLIARIEHFLGNNTAEEVFQAIEKLIKALHRSNKGTPFVLSDTLNATRLNALLTRLRNLVKEQNFVKQAQRLSQAAGQIASAYEYIEYFTAFEKEARKQKQATVHSLASLRDVNPEIAQIQELTREGYQEIITMLNKLTVKEGVQ
jgi:hypothetical protein